MQCALIIINFILGSLKKVDQLNMGQIASRLKEPLHAAGSVAEIITGSRKRKLNETDLVNHEETQTDIHTPKK